MGIKGLWGIVAPCARPVQLDALAGRVLAIDISLWLHCHAKALRDVRGEPLPHAHLVGLLHCIWCAGARCGTAATARTEPAAARWCCGRAGPSSKLLYFGIRPVFVYDGGVPALKRWTLARRRARRAGAATKALAMSRRLLTNALRRSIVARLLSRDHPTATAPSMAEPTSENPVSSDQPGPRPLHGRAGDESRPIAQGDSASIGHTSDTDGRAAAAAAAAAEDDDASDGCSSDNDDDAEGVYEPAGGWTMDALRQVDIDSDVFDALDVETQYEMLVRMGAEQRRAGWANYEGLRVRASSSEAFMQFQLESLCRRNRITQRIVALRKEMLRGAAAENCIELRPIASEANTDLLLLHTSHGKASWSWRAEHTCFAYVAHMCVRVCCERQMWR